MRRLTVTLACLYVGLAVLANWLASMYIVHVPLTPYLAPGGVFCIGAILVLRDWVQQLTGLWFSLLLVLVAATMSYVVADAAGWTDLKKIAVASFVAFVVSETVEAAVFTPLRKRSLTAGVAASGLVGAALDSYIFLTLAFGSLAFFPGQWWAKVEMVAVGTLLTAGRRRFLPVAA